MYLPESGKFDLANIPKIAKILFMGFIISEKNIIAKKVRMQITKINNYTAFSNINRNKVRHDPAFNAHPDFIKLSKAYDVTASNYFRRGGFYGSPAKSFRDVINVITPFFSKNSKFDSNNKIQMLIGGIGHSQEPFSYLAVIRYLIRNRKFEDVMELHTVDLQSKPTRSKLLKQSFYDCYDVPAFMPSSFVRDDGNNYELPHYRKYRVKDDIFQFLADTYKNPDYAKWETRLQDEIKKYPKNKFDIISVNNTLGYIIDKTERTNTLKNIKRILKPEGVFITDTYIDYSDIFTPDVADELYMGIYRKKS